ncbi:MAG: hemerythrin domain-containing protein [Magnetococcales bacterium]|nr:hemerythrin domain-containing protein [Magnetococcales bacterium]
MRTFSLADVGVERFNNDHKRLLFYLEAFTRLAKRFAQHQPKEDDWDQVDQLFPRLERYTQSHFKEEEDLMLAQHYPHLSEHQTQHTNLIKHLEQLKKGVKTRDEREIAKLEDFLLDWLSNHINKSDLQYRGLLQRAETRNIIDSALFNEIISVSQLNQIVKQPPSDALIVDLRTETEQQEGIIPGSHLFPCHHNLLNRQDTQPFKEDFMQRFNPNMFDPEKRYFLICRSGPRTEIALEVFLEHNLMACELIGGIQEWLREGLPLETITPQTPRIGS